MIFENMRRFLAWPSLLTIALFSCFMLIFGVAVLEALCGNL